MPTAPTVKKQHYVPQMYLRLFESERRKTVWVFDKKLPLDSKKNFNSRSISSVAHSEHFYDLPSTLDPSKPELFQRFERELCRVEGIGSKFIRSVNRGLMMLRGAEFDPRAYISPIPRVYDNLACYTAIQYLRTESGREFLRDTLKVLGRAEVDAAVAAVAPHRDPTEFTFTLNETWVKWFHMEAIFDLETFAPYFYQRIFRFGVNSTDIPFWTSDSPVVLISATGGDEPVGLALVGTCVCFPLSPYTVLMLYDPLAFSEMGPLDGKPMNVPLGLVEILNEAQLKQSRRSVISAKPFEQAKPENFERFKKFSLYTPSD